MGTRLFSLFVCLLFMCLHQETLGQCVSTEVYEDTIVCGESVTLEATPNQLTYVITPTNCSPIPITGTNAFPTPCDDCITGQIPIGFSFNFYGNSYTSCIIQSNGIVGFGNFSFIDYIPFTIPTLGAPNNFIAGLFADINIEVGGTITYDQLGMAPNRMFVVSYNSVSPYAGVGKASFQIVLHENGTFQTIVSQFTPNWMSATSGTLATQGAENFNGTVAFATPGRNATDWRGLNSADQDCHLFTPCTSQFQHWANSEGVILSTNPTFTVFPSESTSYSEIRQSCGVICGKTFHVEVNQKSFSSNLITDNSNCVTPNGYISFDVPEISNGVYTLNYLEDGVQKDKLVIVSGGVCILTGLKAAVYSQFEILDNPCNFYCSEVIEIENPAYGFELSHAQNNSSCPGNGQLHFESVNLPNSNQNLTFKKDGQSLSSPVSIFGNHFALMDLNGGNYSHFQLQFGMCKLKLMDEINLLDPLLPETNSITVCVGDTGFIAATPSSVGSSVEWYEHAVGGTAIFEGELFNPTHINGIQLIDNSTSGVHTFFAAYAASPSCRTEAHFTISTATIPPLAIDYPSHVCAGTFVTLTAQGEALMSGSNYEWFSDSCNGTFLGTGSTISFVQSEAKNYFVRSSEIGNCPASACVNQLIETPNAPHTLSENNQSATCLVNSSEYVHFYAENGKLIASINSEGQNLGNVTFTSFVDNQVVDFEECDSEATTALMQRSWTVNPDNQPFSPIDLRLYFKNEEFEALKTTANLNENPNDNLSTTGEIKLKNYTGPTHVDHLASNNCQNSGGTGNIQLHHLSSAGLISNVFSSYLLNDHYANFKINSFDEFWLRGSSLPSNFATFPPELSGKCDESEFATITWNTFAEQNISHFIVEKSTDLVAWQTLGQVPSQGPSDTIQTYQLADESPTNGMNHYRMSQVDLNGNTEQIGPITIRCTVDEEETFAVFPNPTNGNFSVVI